VLPVLGVRAASADFVEALLLHAWPRNVRELQKLAERLCVLHGAAARWEVGMLDDELARRVQVRGRETGDTAPVKISGPPTKDELVDLLARFQGNVTEVARYVGRNRKQVYRWMDQHGIARSTGR
jgi:transcriptional regulator of acetoin/glycerol metabolism